MKKLNIIVILIIAVVAFWFYKNWSEKEMLAPAPAKNSAEVVNEVESINVGDIDTEFDEIDQELKEL